MERQLKGWLQSSQDTTEVANKVKGVILMFSSLIIFFIGVLFHINLSANDMITLASELGTLAGLIWGIYGCFLHLVTWVGTVKAEQITVPAQ